MAIDVKNVGAFGVSFSRGMDQAWVNMYRREQGFLVEFCQNFEDLESDDGQDTDLSWTIDVDDNSDADILLLSGNWKLPPNDWMTPVIEAVRLCEDRFMRCVKEWK